MANENEITANDNKKQCNCCCCCCDKKVSLNCNQQKQDEMKQCDGCCSTKSSSSSTSNCCSSNKCSSSSCCCCCCCRCEKNKEEIKKYKPVDHIIFDLDGLLVDSEVCFANAIAILLKGYGINEYPLSLQEKVLGMEVAKGIDVIIKQMNLPLTVEEFMKAEREIYTKELSKVKLMPGVIRLVKHLKKHNIPMAIATGSTKQSYEIKTAHHQDIFADQKYFKHIIFTRDNPEVKRPKPAPDVYLIAASRFEDKPKPEQCLVFEDSSLGVDGSIAAGMQCIMIPDKRFECKQKNATLILKSLEEFRPELFGLPPFDD